MDPKNHNDVPFKSQVKPILIEDELKDSFLDYAMSVVVSRAIPDIRDGLKPVHRRVLYTMHQLGFFHNKPYHKSVRVVGDVLGKYHPHGDQAVYNTMIGMVQEFSKRYPLLDGQGNWGSIDGDSAAAMRYTEVRMAKIAQEILADLDKDTVRFVPNFDGSTVEPVVLPSKLPQLLINGTTGIAVGMATSIPPHNLTEVVDGCLALLKNDAISDDELFKLIPAPDFPTGGIICGRAGIVKAYKTGRGKLILRGVVEIEENKKQNRLIVTELPYLVNKASLTVRIADLVKNKVVEGITNIKDESSRKGMRLVIDLKRGEIPQVTLNQLYKHTPLQTSVSILMLGLLNNRPMIFSLRELLHHFNVYRKVVIYRRSVYELNKAKAREHILAGFIIALDNIDAVVALVKKAKTPDQAIAELNSTFSLSHTQGKAILEMRLQRLTGLEQEKIHNEMEEIRKKIAYLASIIEDESILRQEIIKEFEAVKEQYGDARRTRIEGTLDEFSQADLVPREEVVITLTRKGYIKRVPLETYGVQHRGGKGKMGMASLEGSDDIVQDLYVTKNHDTLLFFTNVGRVYSLKGYDIPEASRTARGRAVVNLLPLTPGETVVKLLCTEDLKDKYVILLTKKGIVKRTKASEFYKVRSTGIRAITLREGDELVFCSLSSGNESVIIATAHGQGIRFNESEVRDMGRQASGVIGIRLKGNDFVVGMVVAIDGGDILFATSNGYGKRVKIKDFRLAHRGGVGVRTIPTGKRNGDVIGLARVTDSSDILLIDQAGKIIRLPAKEIRILGRQAKGVRLIKLDKNQHLVSIVSIDKNSDSEEEESGEESVGAEGLDLQSSDETPLAASPVADITDTAETQLSFTTQQSAEEDTSEFEVVVEHLQTKTSSDDTA